MLGMNRHHLEQGEIEKLLRGEMTGPDVVQHLQACDPCRSNLEDELFARRIITPLAVDHPDDDILTAWITEALAPARMLEIQEHLQGCERCCNAVERLTSKPRGGARRHLRSPVREQMEEWEWERRPGGAPLDAYFERLQDWARASSLRPQHARISFRWQDHTWKPQFTVEADPGGAGGVPPAPDLKFDEIETAASPQADQDSSLAPVHPVSTVRLSDGRLTVGLRMRWGERRSELVVDQAGSIDSQPCREIRAKLESLDGVPDQQQLVPGSEAVFALDRGLHRLILEVEPAWCIGIRIEV